MCYLSESLTVLCQKFGRSQKPLRQRERSARSDTLSENGLGSQVLPGRRNGRALTIMVSWFIVQTKLDWAASHSRDPQLAEQMGVAELPGLSMANMRAMLRAALPLPQLTTASAAELVVKHLINRTRSRKS